MTRSARKNKKKHLESTSWNDLKPSSSGGDRVSKKKTKTPLKDGMMKTLQNGEDLVKIVKNDHFTKKRNESFKAKMTESSRRKKSNNDHQLDEKTKQRREKRRLRRAKMKECFGCRKSGHRLEECPNKQAEAGICFKCGSTEHGVSQCKSRVPPGSYPFATCFICHEKGHLTNSCPDNPKGLYPHGGGCKFCGSVEHLKVNCPEKHQSKHGERTETLVQLNTTVDGSADADTVAAHEQPKKHKKITKKTPKTVKF